MRSGAEALTHGTPEIVDTVDDLAEVATATTAQIEPAGAGIAVPTRLGERTSGEQVAGTVDQRLVDGPGEAEIAAGDVANGCEAAAQRPLESLRCHGGDVARGRGLDLEHVEADPVGMEVGVDQPGDDEPAAGIDDVGVGGRRRRRAP